MSDENGKPVAITPIEESVRRQDIGVVLRKKLARAGGKGIRVKIIDVGEG